MRRAEIRKERNDSTRRLLSTPSRHQIPSDLVRGVRERDGRRHEPTVTDPCKTCRSLDYTHPRERITRLRRLRERRGNDKSRISPRWKKGEEEFPRRRPLVATLMPSLFGNNSPSPPSSSIDKSSNSPRSLALDPRRDFGIELSGPKNRRGRQEGIAEELFRGGERALLGCEGRRGGARRAAVEGA